MLIDLHIQGDSNLVIQQLQGTWQCRNPGLRPVYEQAMRLLDAIKSLGSCVVTMGHVYRNSNQTADRKFTFNHVRMRAIPTM
jgi:ribonuclease HI